MDVASFEALNAISGIGGGGGMGGGGGDNAVSSVFKNICRDPFSLGEGRPIAPLVSSCSFPSVVIQR